MNVPIEQRVIAIVFSLAFVLLTVQLIRKHKLREAYALGWLISAFIILILSIFGRIVDIVAAWFSVSYTPTLILVIGLLAALVILLLQSVVLSTQADRIRDLAQYSAILEWRLRQLEERERPLLKPTAGQSKNGKNHDAPSSDAPDLVIIQREKDGEELSV
jgi:hypothetical protein